ncbi:MAG: hypothetical protein Q7T32_06265 [Moraxellaceae bacterium]|nr:hypothetical protein [Moraxellaceae bacterium]
MKNNKVRTGIIILAILMLSFALNPSADKHRKKIQQTTSDNSQLEKLLGVGQLKAFASKYESLGFASYTTINDEVASIGVFGMVFVLD